MIPVRVLPVWRTVLDSWRLLIDRAPGMLRVAWLPAIIAVMLEATVYSAVPEPAELSVAILVILLTAIPLTALLVPWYRNVLLDQQPVGGATLWRMQIRHIRFLWRWVLLGILLPIVLLALGLVGPGESLASEIINLALILPVGIGLTYILFRIRLALPAAALGHAARFDRAWQLSEGNGWRLLGIRWLAILPLLIPVVVLGVWDPGKTPSGVNSPLILIVFAIASVFDAMMGATVRALCYRALGGMDGDGAEPPTKATE